MRFAFSEEVYEKRTVGDDGPYGRQGKNKRHTIWYAV